MNLVLVRIVNTIIEIFTVLILIDVIGSWLMVARVNLPDIIFRLLESVRSITGVLLNPLRRVIPSLGGLDLSPIVALLLLDVLRRLLITALLS
jgi:YggT family protein